MTTKERTKGQKPISEEAQREPGGVVKRTELVTGEAEGGRNMLALGPQDLQLCLGEGSGLILHWGPAGVLI